MLSNGTPLETRTEEDRAVHYSLVGQAKPVLKWAGGKRQIEETILYYIDKMHPDTIEEYREPFLGGGAIFFALARRFRFKKAILSDTNAELICMYAAIRDDVNGVIQELQKLCRKRYGSKTYYEIREWRPKAASKIAARMIYLNKTCYNGLYRVNKSGKFNVPFGKRKHPQILDRDGLRAASAALQGVQLSVDGFQYAFLESRRTTFIYYDPPYVPVSTSSNFTAYQSTAFGEVEQNWLARQIYNIATDFPCPTGMALLSNSHCPKTLKLYKGLVRHRIAARRSINSVGSKRGYVSELLVESRLRPQRSK